MTDTIDREKVRIALTHRHEFTPELHLMALAATAWLETADGLPEESEPDYELFGVREFSDGHNALLSTVKKLMRI